MQIQFKLYVNYNIYSIYFIIFGTQMYSIQQISGFTINMNKSPNEDSLCDVCVSRMITKQLIGSDF